MPGSMTHLLLAHHIDPEGSPLFFLGNIAPDAVIDWHEKDITHFRHLTERQPALSKLARETEGDFAEGILLHLYADWKWDGGIRRDYIIGMGSDESKTGWFAPYRHELSLAAGYSFQKNPWVKKIWDDMDAVPVVEYGYTPRASFMDVKEFVSRNNRWHTETLTGPSAVFTLEMIYDFIRETAVEFKKWRADEMEAGNCMRRTVLSSG